MTPSEQDTVIDSLIDLMAELGMLENRIRALRERIEPIADGLFSKRSLLKKMKTASRVRMPPTNTRAKQFRQKPFCSVPK